MTTSLEQQREDQALGAAWRRCEAALSGYARFLVDRYEDGAATVWIEPNEIIPAPVGSGENATEALTALAEALEARAAE